MSEMKALPAWPVRPRPIASDAQTIGYERACYIAALARLRVAVEALKLYGTHKFDCAYNTTTCGPCDCGLYAALASIGDLPAGEEG